MRSHLKVKVYTLAAEMTYIRRQEEKWKSRARFARQKVVRSTEYAERAFWSHRWHRETLKVDARTTHLAYGCMRGIPYSKMENLCYGPIKGYGSSEPDWKSIESMVERFSKDEDSPQLFMQMYSEWFAFAKDWYDGNKDRIEAWRIQREQERQRQLADPVYQQQLQDVRDSMKQLNTPVKV